jgi:hypothetical protein
MSMNIILETKCMWCLDINDVPKREALCDLHYLEYLHCNQRGWLNTWDNEDKEESQRSTE